MVEREPIVLGIPPQDAWAIIDSGSYGCKFGFSGEEQPRFILEYEESPRDEQGIVRPENRDFMRATWTHGLKMLGVTGNTRVILVDKERQNLVCTTCRIGAVCEACKAFCGAFNVIRILPVKDLAQMVASNALGVLAPATFKDFIVVDMGHTDTMIVHFAPNPMRETDSLM